MSGQDDAFSWTRDFKHVSWPDTLKYNFVRSAAAGIVWCLLGLLSGAKWQSFQMLLFPICYFIFMLPLGMLTGWLSGRGVPWVGLFAAFVALSVAIGDPLVFALKKAKPELLPVDHPRFFSLRVVIFVLNQAASTEPTPSVRAEKELSANMFKKD